MKASSNRLSVLCPAAWEHVLVGFVTLIILEQHSRFPEVGLSVFLLTALSLFILGGMALVRLARFFVKKPELHEPSSRSWVNWLVFPVAVLLVVTSAKTHWPASLRFALSRSSFEEVVTRVQNGQEPQGFPKYVGLYWIEQVYGSVNMGEDRPQTIAFVTGAVLIDECGIYYDPTDYDPSHFLTTRIAPNWFMTEW